MDVRSPLSQYTALIVAGVVFLNPIVATAAQLAVDPANKGTTIGAAGNGVPVVNIAAPNGSGLSTNTFSHYNVDQRGIILNNATGKLQGTQLGGIIQGNPNLTNGAAKVILNQVTGGDRSYLGGYTEVAGQAARVIVANPHGVTCNGCGFINTPRVTLTTGTPVMNGDQLERFRVEGGDIAIEGLGLDASRVEQFELITRSARLNAELHAKKLTVVAGRNDVQADSLEATALADDGSEKPTLAIDSSSLGGMYAGAIRLVGTEQGVGVKLAGDMAASAGDIQIDANGKLSMANVGSSGDLRVAAQEVELTGKAYAGGSATISGTASVANRQSLAARDAITVTSAQIDNSGVIEAGIQPDNTRNTQGDLTLRGGDVRNSGRAVASRDLVVEASGTVDNRGGQLTALNDLKVQAAKLDNRQQGALTSAGKSQVMVGALDNRDGGRIIAHAGALTEVKVSGELDNRGGRIASGSEALNVRAGTLQNAGGTVEHGAEGLFTLHADQFNGSGGSLTGLGQGQWTVGRADGTGLWHVNGGLDVSGFDSMTLNAGDQVASAAALSLRGQHLTNAGQIGSNGRLELALDGTLQNSGKLTSASELVVRAQGIDNRGTLGAQAGLSLSASGGIVNQQGGLLFSGGDLQLRADSLYNHYAELYSQGHLSFAALDGGKAGSLRNLSGSIESEGDIDLKVSTLENAKAVFTTGETMLSRDMGINCTDCKGDYHTGFYIVRTTYQGTVLEDSPASRLVANRDLLLDAVTVINGQSLLAANRNMNVQAVNFYNRGFTRDIREEQVSYWLHGVSQSAYRVAESATNRWNEANAGLAPQDQAELPTEVTRYPVSSTSSEITPGTDTAYSGTVQAGGTLNLSVSGQLVNGTLNPHNLAQLTGTTPDSDTLATDGVRVTVGAQPGEPGALPDLHLPQGEYGRFIRNPSPDSRYLVETNPALTDMGRFISSNYLYGLLGLDPDASKRRLGDGAYETRLVADAVRAQTGQRFLNAGLGSDYEQFKYLMDNAVASQAALNLSIGVGLTGEQVAALTHDIMWLETRVVDGQSVLAPVVYLAKAEGRNLRGGSLVQGHDLNLVTGGNLFNVGTLRASDDLGMVVGGSLLQGGLVQTHSNLTVLAQNSIRNALAGEIRADRVNLTAMTGDIVNDRTATEVAVGGGSVTHTDGGSLISARSQLTMDAANDLTNRGRLESGGDATLVAGRDLNLLAVEDRTVNRDTGEHRGYREEHIITQLGSETHAAGNLSLSAGRDVNAIASQASAGQNLTAEAGRDVNLIAAADEHSVDERYKHGKKKIHEVEEHTRQVASSFSAGGDLALVAAQNVNLHASQVAAGGEAYLLAGDQINLTAAQDRDHTLYDMKKKGSWGAKQAQHDEVTDVRAVGSRITSGTDLNLVSGGDQLYQGATLHSGKDLNLLSGGSVTLETVTDLHDESHTKSKSDLGWFSMKGKGNTDETLRQNQLVAQGDLVIQAANKVQIDVRKVDQQTVSQSIDAMVAADPQLAWLKQVEKQGGIDWRQVEELHTSFKYQNSGLGAGAQLAIAIMMAAVMGPAGFGLTGFQLGAAASLATTGTVSTINNKGNLGAAVKETFGKDSLKGAAVSSLTAGSLQYVDAEWFQTAEGSQAGAVSVSDGAVVPVSSTPANVLSWSGASDTLTRAGTHALVSSSINTAVNGGSFGDNLGAALTAQAGTVALATGFNFVGDHTLTFDEGSVPKIIAHALMGGLVAEATGSDFKTGAMAAGLNEALVEQMAGLVNGNKELHLMLSQLTGVVAAAAVDGDIDKGAEIAYGSTYYNRELHAEEREALRKASEQEGLDPARLEKAACYLVECWAQLDRGTAAYHSGEITDAEMAGYSNELAWVQAQQEDHGLFEYGYWDKTKDFGTRDAKPLLDDGVKVVTGGLTVSSGYGLCVGSGGIGCAPGAVMVGFGAGNMWEGAQGAYYHFAAPGETAVNPVRSAFEYVAPGNGLLVYTGVDLLTSIASGPVKVPLVVGKTDGLKSAQSMFGVKVPNALNEKFILGHRAPMGTTTAIYSYGLYGKVAEFVKAGEANGQ